MHLLLLEKNSNFLKIIQSYLEAESFTFESQSDPVIFLEELKNKTINEPYIILLSEGFFNKNQTIEIFKKKMATN